MIVVAHRNEAEWLQDAFRSPSCDQHLGHAVHCAALGLERDLDEIALLEGFRDSQKSASNGNGL